MFIESERAAQAELEGLKALLLDASRADTRKIKDQINALTAERTRLD